MIRLHPYLITIKPFRFLLLLMFGMAMVSSCQNAVQQSNSSGGIEDQKNQHAEAIKSIFTQDAKLGSIRNHACEDTSLTATVRQYVADLDALDFSACPADFAVAFQKHRDAWQDALGFFKPFDELRGEMHDLFEQINQTGEAQKAELTKYVQAITDTWTEVENLARKYGALTE